jgi:hypothetical protein
MDFDDDEGDDEEEGDEEAYEEAYEDAAPSFTSSHMSDALDVSIDWKRTAAPGCSALAQAPLRCRPSDRNETRGRIRESAGSQLSLAGREEDDWLFNVRLFCFDKILGYLRLNKLCLRGWPRPRGMGRPR